MPADNRNKAHHLTTDDVFKVTRYKLRIEMQFAQSGISFEWLVHPRYQLPFRHPVVPEQYLIMWDFHFFDKVHRGFTENETEAHKYMFSRDGALTGAISYYRAFNNDSNQLRKLPYQTINVSTLILWAEKDAFIMSPIAKYNQEWLKTSKVVYYRGAGHWLPRECSTQHCPVDTSLPEEFGPLLTPSYTPIKHSCKWTSSKE
ncbi:hypothetical protein HPB49_025364 [Dermacentor silvarum]|uniref:Uncharacterized protein n=1 Tax=Dermacentor silvarum TaxID=543639 RepID=A0ACB8CIP2_DERSI|nr:hypothetical protein HPB49_025364 [Dermacentor silvarum]